MTATILLSLVATASVGGVNQDSLKEFSYTGTNGNVTAKGKI